MLDIKIPGFGSLKLTHLLLDFNGTLARDGGLLPGVRLRLHALAAQLQLHVVTADTFGTARETLRDIACELSILKSTGQAEAKLAYLERLGATVTVCIGNGHNDRMMLETAALGIAVVQAEGASLTTILAADIVSRSIRDALDLLLKPTRILATLRE